MKKVVLAALLALFVTVFPFMSGCTQKEEPSFAVMSDVHVVAQSYFTEENFDGYATQDKMVHLSESLLNTFADEVIEAKYQFVLISGDLTERGDATSHRVVAASLNRIEEAGIPVYIINGNHDVMNSESKKKTAVSQTEFAEIYAKFGYDEALSRCPDSLSYSVDLTDKYRLIAIDDINYYPNADAEEKRENMPSSQITWILSQLDLCVEDEKEPILMTHQPFVNHWPKLISDVHATPAELAQDYASVLEYTIDAGGRCSFVGHDHLNDVKQFTSGDKTLTEAETGSLIYCSADYRVVTMDDDALKMSTKTIESVPERYLPSVMPTEMKEAVTDNFPEYAMEHFNGDVSDMIKQYIYNNSLLQSLSDTTYGSILTPAVRNLFDKLLYKPIYEKDATEECLETVTVRYGKSLPSTEYRTVGEILPILVSQIVKGDESLLHSPETELLKYTIYYAIYCVDATVDSLSKLIPEAGIIDIDCEKLYSEGKLECYESGIMDLLLDALSTVSINPLIDNMLLGAIDALRNDFSVIASNDYYNGIIGNLTHNAVTDLTDYFSGKEIDMENLLEKGLFEKYIVDCLSDNGDNQFVLE